MTLAYPEDFRNVEDLSLAGTPAATGTLWGENSVVTPEDLSGKGKVWFVGDTNDGPDDVTAFVSAGCTGLEKLDYARMHIFAFACP